MDLFGNFILQKYNPERAETTFLKIQSLKRFPPTYSIQVTGGRPRFQDTRYFLR